MATYCGECSVWIGSDDVDKYGRRWCAFSRKYEKSNQVSTGCKGFSYSGRAVLSEVCNILHLQTEIWFSCFDRVKDNYVANVHMEWLSNYCLIAPLVVKALHEDKDNEHVAQGLLQTYLLPAKSLEASGDLEGAAYQYRKMFYTLCARYYIDILNAQPKSVLTS